MGKHRKTKRERRLDFAVGDTLALGVIAEAGARGASPMTLGFAVKGGRCSADHAESIGFAVGGRLMRRGLVTVTRNNWFILNGDAR